MYLDINNLPQQFARRVLFVIVLSEYLSLNVLKMLHIHKEDSVFLFVFVKNATCQSRMLIAFI